MNSNLSYSLETPNLVKIGDFFSRLTLQFDVWPSETIGHLFYATSSFVHHFLAIGEFKLEIQSRNAQFRSKSTIFFSPVTLQFDVWPWKTIWNLFYATSSASFRSHWWIQTGVTVRKRPIWVKINNVLSRVILQFDIWPWKTIGHLLERTSSYMHSFHHHLWI